MTNKEFLKIEARSRGEKTGAYTDVHTDVRALIDYVRERFALLCGHCGEWAAFSLDGYDLGPVECAWCRFPGEIEQWANGFVWEPSERTEARCRLPDCEICSAQK